MASRHLVYTPVSFSRIWATTWTGMWIFLDSVRFTLSFAGVGNVTDKQTENADRSLGNREGWSDFKPKPLERGAATHIYASFDPSLKGKTPTHRSG